jgi:hypothetical protein
VKKKKAFDCVEMKRKGAALIYERIKDMTPAEELAYWRRRGAALDRKIRAAKKAARSRRKPSS